MDVVETLGELTATQWSIPIIGTLSYIPLWISALRTKGEGQNFSSWILWFGLDVLLMGATILSGGKAYVILMMSVFLFGSLSMSILLMLLKGREPWTKNEKRLAILVGVCVIAFLIFYWLNIPLWAVIFITAAQVVGGVPLFNKTREKPYQPLAFLAYSGFTCMYIIMLYNTNPWKPEDVITPLAIGIFTLILMFPIAKALLKTK